MLRQHGFEVTLYTPETVVSPERFDLMLYLFGDETLLTRGPHLPRLARAHRAFRQGDAAALARHPDGDDLVRLPLHAL